MVSGNVRVMSEMLTELVPTQTEPADLELLQELNRTCRSMQQRVLELIPASPMSSLPRSCSSSMTISTTSSCATNGLNASEQARPPRPQVRPRRPLT